MYSACVPVSGHLCSGARSSSDKEIFPDARRDSPGISELPADFNDAPAVGCTGSFHDRGKL